VPGLTRRHVPEADGHAAGALRKVGADRQRLPVGRERGPPGSAEGDKPFDQSAAGVPNRLRRVDRERPPLLAGFDVPEPEGRGPSFEGQERLAIRQERRHARFAPDDRKPLATAQDRVDDAVRRDVVEPNPAVPVIGPDRPRQEPAVRTRHDSPIDPPGDAARGLPAGRVPEVKVAVLVGGEQAPAVRADEDLLHGTVLGRGRGELTPAGRVPPVDRPAHGAGQDRAVPAERESLRPPLDPQPFLPRDRVVQVDAVAGRGDRFAVGGKGDTGDVLPDLGEDNRLLGGGRLPEAETSVAPTAAGERRPVGREGERSFAAVAGLEVAGREAPQFFPRADLP
jgi:hypothetical protein